MEPAKPSRPSNPPHKSKDFDGWFNWYKEEIKERINKGETKKDIVEALKIHDIDKFLNNER